MQYEELFTRKTVTNYKWGIYITALGKPSHYTKCHENY